MSASTIVRASRRFIIFVRAAGLRALAVTSLSLWAPAAAQEQLDMNAIMPCGTADFAGKQTAEQCDAARDAFMQNCTSCHSFVPIVLLQKDEAGWDATLSQHRSLAPEISRSDFDLIAQFLKDHFRPDRPVPHLPKALIDNDPGFPL